jgi:hypothetical protein
VEKIPLVERRKVVAETRLVVGIVPYKLLNGDVAIPQWVVNFGKQIPAPFVWFDSLSCFSSILHLLPLRSTWVCYLCVQGSLLCL